MSVGMGLLIGMASGARDNQDNDNDDELNKIRRGLSSKLADVVYQTAFKEATAKVHDEMIDELQGGTPGKHNRHLSDPKNVAGRNEAYAKHAAIAVSRISGGRMTMSLANVEDLSKSNTLK